jgi:FLVCR family feline leukemia virus subgroup C receptor-related protein
VIAALGGIFIIFGLISSIIAGVLLDKYSCYLKLYRAICAGTTITFALMLATFPLGNVWLVGVNLAIAGSIVIPIMPVGIAFACELTFPLSETVTNGLL